MIVPIKSIHDLRNEIVRLETLTVQQEAAIKQRFSSPKTIYKTILSAFPKSESSSTGTNANSLFSQDIIGAISKFLLPLTLNKTLFKESGFITRSIVTFLSKKASGYINQDSVTSGWEKLKTAVSKSKIPDTVISKVKPLENLLSKIKFPAKKTIKVKTLAKANTPIVIKSID
ncbi:hypothetical protein [Mucilaginibacter arboris]|uniref:Uncharacterized protein n=1 Tax=Mucilaginibacter arboris TaxID=2682090 RepID=A0A7K1SS42_9SPHI|nr:hypothetical protein [Mucilaginibacter arboris]MVN20136.1 hypothetical protein [Mucilaginibacter arboris]